VTDPATYPSQWEGDVVTADGGTIHVRPVRPDDGPRIEAFHARQSAESIYFRYFSARPRLQPAEIERLVNVDYRDRMTLVAVLSDEVVGMAVYDRWTDRAEAEIAFFIDDEHNGRGLSTILLEWLAAAAREAGIPTFMAHVLPSNRRMISVLKQAGFEIASRFADGVIEVRLGLEPTPEAMEAMERRARVSEARSVARLVEPESVAVIGAGRSRGTIGHEVFRQLLAHEFEGPVHAVNRDAAHVGSVRAYPSIVDVPDRVDVAVVAVPAEHVLEVVADCARARVGGLIIISAGFAETGPAGAEAERAVVSLARRHGMRVIGPNSLGVVNTSPTVRLHATFDPVDPLPGRVALSSQSGALGASILEQARVLGIGISSVVSVGNKADVSGNDLLRYWESDDRTSVVMLYLESFGNPRRFGRIASEVSRVKPIVAVKSGRDRLSDTLLGQTGVIRVDTLDQLLDVARVLSTQPVPAGRGVAVLGNSGGPATLAADACHGAGLVLPPLGPDTQAALQAVLPTGAVVVNPVDLTHAAGPAEYEAAMRTVLADDAIDSALVIYSPPLAPRTTEVARAVGGWVAPERPKPIVASFPGQVAAATALGSIPSFTFPDSAAYALGRASAYGVWLHEPEGKVPDLEGDLHEVRAVVDTALAEPHGASGRWLQADEAVRLLTAAGFQLVELRLVESVDEAAAAAAELGFPVAMKATGLENLPKSEAAGMALDLQDGDEVRHAYTRMRQHLGEAMDVAVVQPMVPPGIDVRVRVTQDELVGTVVGVGPGGAAGQALSDESCRIVPITDAAATRLVDEAPSVRRVAGPGREALEVLLARAGWLADEIPELAEIHLNPVIVGPSGAAVADARLRVAPWRQESLPPVRRI
jgi:acyl-CoA synthetase (NDP forming)/RimJ/RimL family protein N-acetyltransferase